MRTAIGTVLLVAPFAAAIASLIFLVGPLLTLLVLLLAGLGGAIATFGLHLVSL
jgi:hypothetical protein